MRLIGFLFKDECRFRAGYEMRSGLTHELTRAERSYLIYIRENILKTMLFERPVELVVRPRVLRTNFPI
jgi:hypothetical protein